MHARTIQEALSVLAIQGDAAKLVAGSTWIMRAPIRQEETDYVFVSIASIDQLRQIDDAENELTIGALVTHDALSRLTVNGADLDCLTQAALKSANPSIRNSATIGGNICTVGFAAADLIPPLICLDAELEVHSGAGQGRLKITDYLSSRNARCSDEIVTKIFIPRSKRYSAHARLLMRIAGDYPVVNLSCSVLIDQDQKIVEPRIAVGSVEATAKRWTALEEAVFGQKLADLSILELASSLTDDFDGRDGVDAHGAYRLKVMPKVATEAFQRIQKRYLEAAQ